MSIKALRVVLAIALLSITVWGSAFAAQTGDADDATTVWSCTFETDSEGSYGWTFQDVTEQEISWRPSNYEAYNPLGLSWYCSPPDLEGSYAPNSIQALVTPAMNLTLDTSMVVFDAWVNVHSEEGVDGGCFAVWYGPTEEEAQIALLTPDFGLEYNGEVQALSDLFGVPVQGWSGEPGGTTPYRGWTYTAIELPKQYRKAYVRLGFLFASDGENQVGLGMEVDDSKVLSSTRDYYVFYDDADNNRYFRAFSGGRAMAEPCFPDRFYLFDDASSGLTGFAAYSPVNCMGIIEYSSTLAYTHAIVTPWITLPELESETDRITFDYMVRTGFDNGSADPETQAFHYLVEIRTLEGNWVDINSLDGGSALIFDDRVNDGQWISAREAYAADGWTPDLSSLAGQDVQIRFKVVNRGVDLGSDPINGFWEYLVWDDIIITKSELTSSSESAALPEAFALQSAYPNPFNPTLNVVVALPETAHLNVAVFNSVGQKIAELVNGVTTAGEKTFVFNGSQLASGVYFVRASVPEKMSQVKRVVLTK